MLTALLTLALTSSAVVAVDLFPQRWNGTDYGCKCYVGDDCWPTAANWTSLNTTVDSNLFVSIPPGAVCHDVFEGPLGLIKTYDKEKCAEMAANFAGEQYQVELPTALLWTYFTNETCRPTENPAEPCTLGYYPVYGIMARNAEHVRAGVEFASRNNLRLVIRNTGHDFIGRSTGWGSLLINTHNLQDVKFVGSWNGPGGYSGGAVTVGAGVQAREFLTLAHKQTPPLVALTGECPTVGIAGGLVGGGGHGPLTTLLGLVADNALEFKVVTAEGKFATANADENPDLFWALKGGGPNSYAVITSATYRTFHDMPSAGAILEVNATHSNDSALIWEGIRLFHNQSNYLLDKGLYVYFEVRPGPSLHVWPFVAVNQTAAQLEAALAPVYGAFDSIGLPYYKVVRGYPTFYDLYIDLFEDEGAGSTAITGGWMFTRDDVAANNDAIVSSFRNALDKGAFVVGHLWDASGQAARRPGGTAAGSLSDGERRLGVLDSAAHPAFRRSSDLAIVALPVSDRATVADKETAQRLLTFDLDEAFRRAGPGGCAYVNEGDPFQPGWQRAFWGDNYERLVRIRKAWDPRGVFYAVSTPGTEGWDTIDYGTRLCKKL